MQEDNRKAWPFKGQALGAGLLLREKLAVFVILFILATIASLSYHSKQNRIAKTKRCITVHCVGAIDRAKSVELPLGAQVADLLAKVALSRDADVNKLQLQVKLENEQVFVVPKRGVLSLYVTGAVRESGVICVPEGLKYNQLKDYIAFTDDADLASLRRKRRLLREGEMVQIGKRSELVARK